MPTVDIDRNLYKTRNQLYAIPYVVFAYEVSVIVLVELSMEALAQQRATLFGSSQILITGVMKPALELLAD